MLVYKVSGVKASMGSGQHKFNETTGLGYHNHISYNNGTYHRERVELKLHDNNTQNKKLKVSVYYETLCPASVEFFADTLRTTMDRLSSYIDVHLVPYGHIEESTMLGRSYFKCQHGPAECFGNMIHACAINVISDKKKALKFNICLMKYGRDNRVWDFQTALHHCGRIHAVYVPEVIECFQNIRSDNLLSKYGEETYNFFNRITEAKQRYVPYVVFENYGANTTEDRTSNFLQQVCNTIVPKPNPCYHR
ncbi:GILT-like protein 2 [Aricia agestis]|uniref:GILT-like protein 2 n=1 Tax=Aricia agestis TaxID=91739 RepID=UPI001C204624|nr:GILT-like protein 2 [Aricia agestis]